MQEIQKTIFADFLFQGLVHFEPSLLLVVGFLFPFFRFDIWFLLTQVFLIFQLP